MKENTQNSPLSKENPAPNYVKKSLGKITIHGFSTGFVKVKRSHQNPSLGFGQIILDAFWTDWLPIYTWLIEHPEGNFLVDTGENIQVLEKDYLKCGGVNGWVNKRILKFKLLKNWDLNAQLIKRGFKTEDISQVILTHLHLDHTDGIRFFPKADFWVSPKEYTQPFGAVPCTFPSWFKPKLVNYVPNQLPYFGASFSLTQAQDIWMVASPGHSHGHQSVLIKNEAVDVLLAGDATFTQSQLINKKVAGICVDKSAARRTIEMIQNYARARHLVYLPSHDPDSGKRLEGLQSVYNYKFKP